MNRKRFLELLSEFKDFEYEFYVIKFYDGCLSVFPKEQYDNLYRQYDDEFITEYIEDFYGIRSLKEIERIYAR